MMGRPSLTSASGVPIGSASLLLDYLGIDEPHEIDVEAIAQAVGATVMYDELQGCEARLVGAGQRALITVDAKAPRARQRFSAAHELGHWIYDRGKVAFQCAEGQLNGEWGQPNPERRANRFAADLLLPRTMFKKLTRNRPITFSTVRELSADFETSLTATAIRLVELGSFPAMLVCHDRSGKRRWSAHNHLVPPSLKPRDRILPGPPGEVPADRFIAAPGAAAYRVLEDSQSLGAGLTLSLLWWKDEAQIHAALAAQEAAESAR